MPLYLIHGTADKGAVNFGGLPVRASGKAAAMRKARAEGLAPRGIRAVTQMPVIDALASDRFQAIARRLTENA